MPSEPAVTFERWVERWNKAIAAARAHGAGDSTRLQIAPPATEDDVREVESELKMTLPAQFRQTLLEFSARVEFFWFLGNDENPPGPLAGIFCGGCRWDLGQLIHDNQHVTWLSENAYVEDSPDETIWKAKLPFHSVACGDFIAIDHASGRVVYLGHELAGSHAHWLGRDFFDFMDRWTTLGCPDDDIWDRFVPRKDGFIDLDHENAQLWCEWFGLPSSTKA